jgi:hypothetical protein
MAIYFRKLTDKECIVTPCMAIPWPNKNFSTIALEEIMIH